MTRRMSDCRSPQTPLPAQQPPAVRLQLPVGPLALQQQVLQLQLLGLAMRSVRAIRNPNTSQSQHSCRKLKELQRLLSLQVQLLVALRQPLLGLQILSSALVARAQEMQKQMLSPSLRLKLALKQLWPPS